ncbi:SSU ribosomal protein S5p (S2e) [hydrothermal vent metagenome]|uniref:SSU ribosomal protein S5p (S2e) n=1 Tax=hydrothermal vent metagenome TaxID=652676 RepID=A0A3B1DXU1_9ZZZZ
MSEIKEEKVEAVTQKKQEPNQKEIRRKPNSPKKFSKEDKGQDKDEVAFIEQVISINRITKVTKGGKKLSFSALVVVGDTKGRVGYSLSKAREVAIAIRKAMGVAKKNMIQVKLKGTTIPHEIIGQCGGARVLLKPASEGTGVIASGPVRAVCDGAGIHNILTKCHRSNNPINVVKAVIDGLTRLKSVNQDNKNATE